MAVLYYFMKETGMKIFNPVLLSWIYVFFIYKGNFFSGELPALVSEALKLIPDYKVTFNSQELYFFSGKTISYGKLMFGFTRGIPADLFKFNILVGLFILVFRRAISFRIFLSGAMSFLILSSVFYMNEFNIIGKISAPEPFFWILTGSFLYLLVFVVSNKNFLIKRTNLQILYGISFGVISYLFPIILAAPKDYNCIIVFGLSILFFLLNLIFSKKKV
jgi:hypothetical protein